MPVSIWYSVVQWLITFIVNLGLMLIITMVIAALTLIERKFLALNQRRVGPYYVGYRGRLQYIADALKLFIKGVVIYDESNKFWFIAVPSFAGLICYFFWVNSVWCPSVSIVDIEYNLVYASLLSVSFGFCIILLGYFSGNKYTRLASIRAALSMLNLELFLGLMILTCVTVTESFCFSVFVLYQENYWLIFTFFGLSGIICIIFLLEVGRTPFDLAEAESELVVGYSTEIGGFTFGIFYLGEYFHLFFFSAVISILFFGGWEFPNFIFNYLNIDEFINILYIILINLPYFLDIDLDDIFYLACDYLEEIIVEAFYEFLDSIENNSVLNYLDYLIDFIDFDEILHEYIIYFIIEQSNNLIDLVMDLFDDLYVEIAILISICIDFFVDALLDFLYDLPIIGNFLFDTYDDIDSTDYLYLLILYINDLFFDLKSMYFESFQDIYIMGFIFYYIEDIFDYVCFTIDDYLNYILDLFLFNIITESLEDIINIYIELFICECEEFIDILYEIIEEFAEIIEELLDFIECLNRDLNTVIDEFIDILEFIIASNQSDDLFTTWDDFFEDLSEIETFFDDALDVFTCIFDNCAEIADLFLDFSEYYDVLFDYFEDFILSLLPQSDISIDIFDFAVDLAQDLMDIFYSFLEM